MRQGRLVRVCRGGYADALRLEAADPQDLHRVQVAAVLRAGGDSLAASHQSAAVVLGLPVLAKDLAKVHVVRRRPGGTGRRFDAFTRHECSETEFEQVGSLWSVGPVAAVLGTAAMAPSLSGQALGYGVVRTTWAQLFAPPTRSGCWWSDPLPRGVAGLNESQPRGTSWVTVTAAKMARTASRMSRSVPVRRGQDR